MQPRIAVILARSHSKGIPLKNLCRVGGKSLLARAIEAAEHSALFDRIVVSTDGEAIAHAARKYPGVEILPRPDTLASDTAKSIDAMPNVFQQLKISSGTAVLLQPASTLCNARHIRNAWQLFQQQNCGSVISCCVAGYHPCKMLIKQADKYFPVNQLAALEPPRQQLPLAVRPNGAIYINHIEDLISQQAFFIYPVTIFEISAPESIDIDAFSDLQQAEKILMDTHANSEKLHQESSGIKHSKIKTLIYGGK